MCAQAVTQVEWIQAVNTLHRQVDILYVVDGYEVTVTWDDNPISGPFHGDTVAEAIDKAMTGFDLGAKPKWLDKDIYGHERQMAAMVAQRDELLEVLEVLESCAGWLEWLDDPRSGLGDNHKKIIKQARAAIAKARGEK